VGDQHKYFSKGHSRTNLAQIRIENLLVIAYLKTQKSHDDFKIVYHLTSHVRLVSPRWDTVYRFWVGLIIKDELWQSLWFKRFPLNEIVSNRFSVWDRCGAIDRGLLRTLSRSQSKDLDLTQEQKYSRRRITTNGSNYILNHWWTINGLRLHMFYN